MGWVAAMILVGFLLPLLGMLYLDILEAKREVKTQVEKVEKLRRNLEQKEREEKK
jgi:cell division protein FtsB